MAFILVEYLYLEVFPKVGGTEGVADGRAGFRARRARNERAIGLGKLNLDDDADDFFLIAVILLGLLGAVVHDALAGELGDESERSEESDRRDIGTGFGHREQLCVFRKQVGEVLSVALAEEIGFADGFFGEGSGHGKGRRRQQQDSYEKAGRGAEPLTHLGSPLEH